MISDHEQFEELWTKRVERLNDLKANLTIEQVNLVNHVTKTTLDIIKCAYESGYRDGLKCTKENF